MYKGSGADCVELAMEVPAAETVDPLELTALTSEVEDNAVALADGAAVAAASGEPEDKTAEVAEIKASVEATIVIIEVVEVFGNNTEAVVVDIIAVVVEVFAKLNSGVVVDKMVDVVEVGQLPPGTVSVWPTSNKSQLTFGFAPFRASKVTPRLSAIV